MDQLRREWQSNRTSIQKMLSTDGVKEITSRWEQDKLSQLIYKYQRDTFEPALRELVRKIEEDYRREDIIKEIHELGESLREDRFFIERHLIG